MFFYENVLKGGNLETREKTPNGYSVFFLLLQATASGPANN